ncbi:hypothetical protein Tco_0453376 [Tanacetum coccineum]
MPLQTEAEPLEPCYAKARCVELLEHLAGKCIFFDAGFNNKWIQVFSDGLREIVELDDEGPVDDNSVIVIIVIIYIDDLYPGSATGCSCTLLTAAGFGGVDASGTEMVATAVNGSLVPGRTTRARWSKISSRIKLARSFFTQGLNEAEKYASFRRVLSIMLESPTDLCSQLLEQLFTFRYTQAFRS